MTSLPSGRRRAGSSTTSASTSEQPAGQREQLADRFGPARSRAGSSCLRGRRSWRRGRTRRPCPSTNVRSRRGSRRPRWICAGAREELAQHRREDGALGLARAVGVERPQDDRRHAVAAVEGEGQLVGGDLGGRVRRLGLERVRLRDRQRGRRAVDLAGRGLDEPPDAVAPGGLERVERAADVRVDERLRRDVGVRDRDQRGQVEDHLDVLGRRLDEPRVADVAELDVDAGADRRVRARPASRPSRASCRGRTRGPRRPRGPAARRGGCR